MRSSQREREIDIYRSTHRNTGKHFEARDVKERKRTNSSLPLLGHNGMVVITFVRRRRGIGRYFKRACAALRCATLRYSAAPRRASGPPLQRYVHNLNPLPLLCVAHVFLGGLPYLTDPFEAILFVIFCLDFTPAAPEEAAT